MDGACLRAEALIFFSLTTCIERNSCNFGKLIEVYIRSGIVNVFIEYLLFNGTKRKNIHKLLRYRT